MILNLKQNIYYVGWFGTMHCSVFRQRGTSEIKVKRTFPPICVCLCMIHNSQNHQHLSFKTFSSAEQWRQPFSMNGPWRTKYPSRMKKKKTCQQEHGGVERTVGMIMNESPNCWKISNVYFVLRIAIFNFLHRLSDFLTMRHATFLNSQYLSCSERDWLYKGAR